jgi:hypothetical protein
VTIADRTWDHLPPEIHDRIMAATAHASERVIRHSEQPETGSPEGTWEVSALAGDRFVHMLLGRRGDGSVSEETDTFLVADLLDISFDADGALIEVPGPAATGPIRVSDAVGRAIARRSSERSSWPGGSGTPRRSVT